MMTVAQKNADLGLMDIRGLGCGLGDVLSWAMSHLVVSEVHAPVLI